MGDDTGGGLLNIGALDRTLGRRVPYVEAPLLNEVRIALRQAQDFLDRLALEINAFDLRWADERSPGGYSVELVHLGICEKALGIGFCITGKGGNLRQPRPHKKQRKIALRDLVAGNDDRGQFLGRQVLHLVEKNSQRHTALVRGLTHSYQ